MSPTVEQCRVLVGSTPIYYQVAGSGPPVVLVHGLSGSGRWWAKNVPALAKRFRVHVIDLVRFGRSKGPQAFVLREAAACLVAWMDAVGLAQASLVGHSMGGYVTAEVAAEYPERVDRLVLVDAAVLPFKQGYLGHAAGLLRALRYVPFGFLPVLIADAWRAGPLTVLRAARELLTADLSPELGRIRAPTLIVWGENDLLLPPELGKRLSECIAGARLVVVEKAGHNPMWDRPDAFNDVVMEFLSGDGSGEAMR